MTTSPELQAVRERIPLAVREAAEILDYTTSDGGLTSPAEIADCAHDQLCDYTVHLTDAQMFDVDADIIRYVLWALGLDGGASDATDVDDAARLRVAKLRTS